MNQIKVDRVTERCNLNNLFFLMTYAERKGRYTNYNYIFWNTAFLVAGRRETMTDHKIGTREEWLEARLELLKAEKALTRRSDELALWRQELPWVRIDKEYLFETDDGTMSLADLFRGHTAYRLSLHVRPRIYWRLPGMLCHRRRLQRFRRASRTP